ncbi:MAG TPA: hypothetical protein DCW31_03750, partial [Lactobacillus sp.]|nr:hypothetical protein [Lactobacillus sp.]
MESTTQFSTQVGSALKKTLLLIGLFFLYQIIQLPSLIGFSMFTKASGTKMLMWIAVAVFGVLAVCGFIWLCYRTYKRLPPVRRYWAPSNHPVKVFSLYVMTWFLFEVLYIGFRYVMSPTRQSTGTPANQTHLNQMFGQVPVFAVLLTIFIAPVIEELIFRGILMRLLFADQSTSKKVMTSIIVSSLLFALLHASPTNLAFIQYLFCAAL